MSRKQMMSLVLCGGMIGSLASGAAVSAEESVRETYTPNFTASGTAAETYNTNMAELVRFFGEYYAQTDELDKVAGYDEPISFSTTGWYGTATADAYAKFEQQYGETLTQNRWIDLYKQLFNVDAEYKYMVNDASGEYTQKLRLDMAAGELPDIFVVTDQSDLLQLADSGLIWDLTDIVEEYATDELKELYVGDGGIAVSKATKDGALYGLPSKVSDTDNFSYLWIRKDWREKLGMEKPTTVEELTALMDAFVNADFDGNGENDTIGLALDKGVYYNTRGLASAYGAYPENWIEKDGSLVWGGVCEENKATLTTLADWYQKGYISKEFITDDGTAATESLVSGKCGIVYGGHWYGHTFGDNREMDPEADWEAVMLPTGNGEEVKSPLTSGVAGWVVVNADFEHPEIAVKMQTVLRAAFASTAGQWFIFDENVSWHTSPIRSIVPAFDNLFTWQNLRETYEQNDESLLKGKSIIYWENLHGDLQYEWELMFGPDDDTPMAVLEDSYENDKLFYDAYYGEQSEFMQDRWSTIKDEQQIAFTKMIIGELDVEEGFAQWQNTFQSLGGDQITEEVNEWYQNK